jgi:hypothetical protein
VVCGTRSVADLVYKHELDDWGKRKDMKLVVTVDPCRAQCRGQAQARLLGRQPARMSAAVTRAVQARIIHIPRANRSILQTCRRNLDSNIERNLAMSDLDERYKELSQGTAPRLGTSDAEKRKFIMKQLAKPHKGVNINKYWAFDGNWFFPEYANESSVRDRMVKIAIAHAGLGPTVEQQIIFFSLNGYFNWDQARQSANTKTTCGLFVRACRAAANILEKRDWTTGTPTIDQAIVGTGGAVIRYDSARNPNKGDIFHIQPDPNDPKADKNNHHVGVIISHIRNPDGSWTWDVVEGGQTPGGLWTKRQTHTLKKTTDKTGDHHWLGKRFVAKWIDVGRLADNVLGY